MLALICAAGTSSAQTLEVVVPETSVINEQIDLDAEIEVEAETTAELVDAATANAAALGNTMSAHTGDLALGVDSDQQFGGRLRSRASTEVGGAGLALSTASTFANTATVSGESGDIGAILRQDVAQGSEAISRATTTVRNGSDSAVAAAQSAANAAALLPGYSTTGEGTILQSNGAETVAVGRVNGQGGAPWVSSATGVAAGNAITAGDNVARVLLDAEQTNTGVVRGKAFIDADVAREAVAASDAAGNTILVRNDNRYAGLNAAQDNQADINARTEVTLKGFEEVASLSASGVGNSAVVSNIGSEVGAEFDQVNSGRVRAIGEFAGDNGSVGLVTTTAFGNAASAYACSECPDSTAGGVNRQVNDGKIVSRARADAYTGELLSSSATAVGNSATYETRDPGGGH